MTQLEEAVLNKFRDFRVAFEALCDSRYGTLPTASTSTKGGIIVGGGLSMVGDTLTVTMQGGTDNDADIAELDGKIATLNDSITVLDVNLNTALTRLDQLDTNVIFDGTSDLDDIKADIVLIESRLDDFDTKIDSAVAAIDEHSVEYTLPTASTTAKGGVVIGGGLSMIGDTLNVTLQAGSNYVAGNNVTIDGNTITAADTNTTYSDATTTASGLMSATDKVKLNGIAASANNYTLPTASTSTKGGVIVGSGLKMSGDTLSVDSSSSVLTLGTTASTVNGSMWIST